MNLAYIINAIIFKLTLIVNLIFDIGFVFNVTLLVLHLKLKVLYIS